MKFLRRMITGGLLGAVLAVAMAASPAQAAATVLYVDPSVTNNSGNCPAVAGPSTYPSLQAALTALGSTKTNVTIYVCPDIYQPEANAVVFDGFTNLKVIGKGGPFLMNISGALTGPFIGVTNSTKVTVSGLVLNGMGWLSTGGSAMGILFVNSSGTIRKNVVMDWHQDYSAAPNQVEAGIMIYTSSTAHKVVVDRNSLLNTQNYGIITSGPGKTQITRNRIDYHSDLAVPAVYPPGPAFQAGIGLYEAGPGVRVSGNVINSNSGEEPLCGSLCSAFNYVSRGILVFQSSGAVIKGNTVSFLKWGISVESWCHDPTSTLTQTLANKNIISGNKLNNNGTGLQILAENNYGTACVPHANRNTVTGNKLNRYSFDSTLGVYLKATLPATAAKNVVKKNKFYGYFSAYAIGPDGDGVTELVDHPNTFTSAPLTGAAPSAAPQGVSPAAPPPMPTLPLFPGQ